MRIDLHMHTTASDGLLDPAAVIRAAGVAGISAVSITDHDSVDGLAEAAGEAAAAGVGFVPGVELTAYWRRVEFHILGYFLDPTNAALRGFLAETRGARHARLHAMLGRLHAMGMGIDAEEVLVRARNGNVGRPHLARALVERGFVTSADEAFDRYLGTDRPAYVPRPNVTVEEAIRVVREAGGITSLAHPGLHNRDDALPDLKAAGLEAIEVYHPHHGFGRSGKYRRLAQRYGLLTTGGSDFHGEGGGDHGASPGVPSLPETDFSRLLAAAESKGWRPAVHGQ